jgi:hypothetical protein
MKPHLPKRKIRDFVPDISVQANSGPRFKLQYSDAPLWALEAVKNFTKVRQPFDEMSSSHS